MSLADNKCVPCRGGVPPLEPAKIQELLAQLEQGWELNKDGHIERMYTFKNFAEALAFVNRVGAVAEAEGHHPDSSMLHKPAASGISSKDKYSGSW